MVLVDDELRSFNLVQAEIHGLYHEVCAKLGISDSASYVLYTVAAFGEGCTPRDVYRNFGTSRQTIHSAVSALVREGCIFLQKGPGRERRIHLTEKGQALVRERIAPLIRLENALLCGWPEEDRRDLLRLLQNYRDDLKRRLAGLEPGSDPAGPAA
ncbi:MAG: MarR family winged helix-turn-helix transcriptional regulator [Desulfovibrio sp.]|nr:MarR family winged helix-turn-helix transcriptional regulator [Desulfovibrio sp.]